MIPREFGSISIEQAGVSHEGPNPFGGLPRCASLPASGPERRAGLDPCGTRTHGRKCGKRVVHLHSATWACPGCGADRTAEVVG